MATSVLRFPDLSWIEITIPGTSVLVQNTGDPVLLVWQADSAPADADLAGAFHLLKNQSLEYRSEPPEKLFIRPISDAGFASCSVNTLY